jgi:hypothetical protein
VTELNEALTILETLPTNRPRWVPGWHPEQLLPQKEVAPLEMPLVFAVTVVTATVPKCCSAPVTELQVQNGLTVHSFAPTAICQTEPADADAFDAHAKVFSAGNQA